MTTGSTTQAAPFPAANRVLALCGGSGGAKLALGLYSELGAGRLTVIVNTGDDFEHLGLHVAPDLDTVLYTLAGLADPARGWGRADESWNFMAALGALGGETWFALGDRDLAVHVERTRRLRSGETLTAIAADMTRRFNVEARIAPMSDDAVRTIVHTPGGPMSFQHYFVKHRCAPVVERITFAGAAKARPGPVFGDAMTDPALRVIVICPSNPYLSVDPILAVPGIREALEGATIPVIAVSPVIGGEAVKGPTAKIMKELGIDVTSKTISGHYHGLINGLVIDAADAADAGRVGVRCVVTRTLMKSLDDRRKLARDVLAFAEQLARERETA
ncbi:MAG: 2-phospho-L-lactate transferase [Burkholderiales bacterium]